METYLKLLTVIFCLVMLTGNVANAGLTDMIQQKKFLPKKGTSFEGSFQPSTIGIDKPDLEQNRYIDDGRDGGTTIIDPPDEEDEPTGLCVSKCHYYLEHPEEYDGSNYDLEITLLCEEECNYYNGNNGYSNCYDEEVCEIYEDYCITYAEWQQLCASGNWP